MIIATKDRFIHYLSEVYVGKTHDYSLLKAEFPPDKAWFANFTIRAEQSELIQPTKACKTIMCAGKRFCRKKSPEELI